MNQKEIDWPNKFANILKEKSVNRRHYETKITSEPFQLVSEYLIKFVFFFCPKSTDKNSRIFSPLSCYSAHYFPYSYKFGVGTNAWKKCFVSHKDCRYDLRIFLKQFTLISNWRLLTWNLNIFFQNENFILAVF